MIWALSLSTMKLSPHCLTPEAVVSGIRSLIGFSNLVRPLVHSVLYHRHKSLRLALKLFRGERAITEFD